MEFDFRAILNKSNEEYQCLRLEVHSSKTKDKFEKKKQNIKRKQKEKTWNPCRYVDSVNVFVSIF